MTPQPPPRDSPTWASRSVPAPKLAGAVTTVGPRPVLIVSQHVIAALLIVVGLIRALGDGTGILPPIAAAVALTGCYLTGVLAGPVSRSPRTARAWLAMLSLVWVAALVASPEFVWFAFLLWLLAGQLLPWPSAIGYSIAVFALVVVTPVWHHGTTSYANIVGPLIGGIFALGISRGYLRLLADAAERERLVSSLRQAQQDMADLHDELALTQRHAGAVAERTRLAHDIHDTIAQSISSIRLLAHAADDAHAPGALKQIESLAADGGRDIRRIVAALAPAELEDGALAAALSRMAARLSEESGILAEVRVDGSITALPAAVEVALLRTAQSALANVRLHSGARRVVISLVDDDDEVRLDIVDDGRGFDPTVARATGAGTHTGYGIDFMRSRLRQLGGDIDIEAAPGEGAALSAHVPIRQRTEVPR